MPAYVYKNVRVSKRGTSTPMAIQAGGQWYDTTDETFVGASSMPEAAQQFEEITEPEFVLRLLKQHQREPFVAESSEPGLQEEPVYLNEAQVIMMAKERFAELLSNISELPHSLDVTKQLMKNKVDKWAGETRLLFITEAPGQQMTYSEKADEASRWFENGQPSDVSEYPFLSTESASTGKTVLQLATEFTNNAALWKQIGSAIEGSRMKAKNAIDALQDVDSAVAVLDTLRSELDAIAAQG